AIGGRVGGAKVSDDEIIGSLVLGAGVQSPGDLGKIQLLAVRPYAANGCDRAFAESDGEIGVVAITARGRAAAGAAFAATAAVLDDLLIERRRPDDLAAEAGAPDDAGNRSPFGRSRDAKIVEAGASARTGLARAAEKRLIDIAAGEGAHLAADHSAGERCAEHGDAGR